VLLAGGTSSCFVPFKVELFTAVIEDGVVIVILVLFSLFINGADDDTEVSTVVEAG
jgi:hypothetical protein